MTSLVYMPFQKTDVATITSVITDGLCRLNLPLTNMRAQCYDGANNISGVHSGVQRRIQTDQPKAVYVHCTSHSLNLAIQDVSYESGAYVTHCHSLTKWQHFSMFCQENRSSRITSYAAEPES